MFSWVRLWVGSLLLVSYAAAGASVPLRLEKSLPHGEFRTGVGSRISFELPAESRVRRGFFLGRLLEQDASESAAMLLDEKSTTVYFVGADSVRGWDDGFEAVLNPYQQQGGTCTGYAIDHFLVQTHFSGFHGTGDLAEMLATEKGRSALLVDAINQYYLVMQHRYSIQGIMNGFGKQFGFRCRTKTFDTVEKARAHILEKLATGSPVLLSFGVGTQMVTSQFKLVQLAENGRKAKKFDPRLWIPRRRGERDGGGHSIVAVAAFEFRGKTQLLMLDSDWSEPRIWDLEEYVGEKTALDELELLSCS